MNLMMELLHLLQVLTPVADAFAGTKYSKTVNLSNAEGVLFQINKGAGAVGTVKFTVQACTAADGSNPVEVPFFNKIAGTLDTYGARAYQGTPATGYTSPPAADDTILLEVTTRMLPEAHPFVRVKCLEVVDDPITGSINALVYGHHYSGDQVLSGS